MTPEERQRQMTERNAAICAYYIEGHTLRECASHFRLGRQRTQQVLEAGGVWKPYIKSDRSKFLGVTVTEETKAALRERAENEGISMSRFASDLIEGAVKS